MRKPDNLFDSLAGMSLLLLSEETVTSILEAVVAAAVGSIHGCEAGRVTVVQGGRDVAVGAGPKSPTPAGAKAPTEPAPALTVPIVHKERLVGVLDLWASASDGLDEEAQDSAQLLVAAAAQLVGDVLALAHLREQARRLSGELYHPTAQATGVLMERGRCSREAAEDLLRRHSTTGGETTESAARAVILSSRAR